MRCCAVFSWFMHAPTPYSMVFLLQAPAPAPYSTVFLLHAPAPAPIKIGFGTVRCGSCGYVGEAYTPIPN